MLFTPAASAQSRGLGVVNGELRGNAGEHIAGGSVKFILGAGESIQANADKDGKWRAVGVGKGQWRVLVSAPGYAARVVTLVIEKETFGTDPVVTVLRRLSMLRD
ncbi:MAG TPA: hypothetical protein VGQ37_15665 [Vicinamibacterales bacterium]|nr:hypothetical protein [Vicinamibacterales bacterium]